MAVVDGRTARAARNRQAVIDAVLELMDDGVVQPTAKAVAERAGVATRSVFHYFADVESLYSDAAETQARRHWTVLLDPVTGDLGERIHTLVTVRSMLFERIAGTRRAAMLLEHQSPVIAAQLDKSRAALRTHLRTHLPELEHLGAAAGEAACAAASWEIWDVLRRHQALSADAASAAMRSVLCSLLTPSQTDH